MKERLSVAASVVVILMMTTATSFAAGSTAIVGKVINGTAGSTMAAGLEITIAELDSSGKDLSRAKANTAADGSFSVSMDTVTGSHFVIATTYKGVTYSTVADQGDGSSITVQLSVYETTDDDGVVKVDSDTITVVKGRKDDLEILQLIKITNDSDRTYVGTIVNDAPRVLDLPVAVGATNLAPGEGVTPNRITTYEDGISSGDPLQPGQTTISFVYKVRVPRTGWAMSRTIAYPTSHIDLLVGPGLDLSAPGFTFQESKLLGGSRYKRFRIGRSEPGSIIDGTITDDAGSSKGLMFGLAAGLSAIVAITLGTLGMKKKRPSQQPTSGRASVTTREDLVKQIALLDESFEAGELADSAYQETRTELKKRLMELTEESITK
jgi:hypothetical protein